MKQYQKAVDYCTNLIAAHPENPHIKIELARIFIYQQRYDRAEIRLSQAESIDPDNKAALLLRAKMWRAKGNASKAIEYYHKFLQDNPEDVAYKLELGNYLIDLRQWKMALHHFEAALETSPNHIDFLERYAWILATCPNPRFRNGQKAMEYAERIKNMRKFTEDQEFRSAMTIAVTYAELKDFDTAQEIVNDNLIKWQSKNLKDYYLKFEALQKIFKAKKPYRL
jgi:tetratricopeptide (TPR) repeat protein